MDELFSVVELLQRRLVEYRSTREFTKTSLHIASLQIAISLVEISLKTEPKRTIEISEEKWFKAGFEIDSILIHSDWEDVIGLYYKMIDLVKLQNYFRHGPK